MLLPCLAKPTWYNEELVVLSAWWLRGDHILCCQARHKDGSTKSNLTTRTLVRLYAMKFIIHSLWVLAEIAIR
jgi:hypothetical protein